LFAPFGCVDITPLTTIVSGDKIFVLCEMEAGKRIEANIYYTGDLLGGEIKRVTNQDFMSFALAEGDKDAGYAFEYDSHDSIFYINTDKFEIKSGLTYRFLGIGASSIGGDPKIRIPIPIALDSFHVHKIELGDVDGKMKTNLETTMTIPSGVSKSSYFYIILTSENNAVWSVDKFPNHAMAYNKLSHSAGFLVDYSMISGNELKLNVSISEAVATSKVNVKLYNVTESFYRYHLYASNVLSSSTSHNANPSIAGFNIQTDKAVGSFSALSGTTQTYQIR